MVECWLCLRVEGGRGGEFAGSATCLVEWKVPDRSSPSSGIFAGENMPQRYYVAHTLMWTRAAAVQGGRKGVKSGCLNISECLQEYSIIAKVKPDGT